MFTFWIGIAFGASIGCLFGIVSAVYLMTKAVKSGRESNSVFQDIQRENGRQIKRIADILDEYHQKKGGNP